MPIFVVSKGMNLRREENKYNAERHKQQNKTMEKEIKIELNGILLKGYQSGNGLTLFIKSGVSRDASEEEITNTLISLAHSLQSLCPMEAKKENGLSISFQSDELHEIYDLQMRCRVRKGDEEDSWTYGGDLRVRRCIDGRDVLSEKVYFSKDCTTFGAKIDFSIPFGSSALPSDEDF